VYLILGKDAFGKKQWSDFGGGSKKETDVQCASRELEEETHGIFPAFTEQRLQAVSKLVFHFPHANNLRRMMHYSMFMDRVPFPAGTKLQDAFAAAFLALPEATRAQHHVAEKSKIRLVPLAEVQTLSLRGFFRTRLEHATAFLQGTVHFQRKSVFLRGYYRRAIARRVALQDSVAGHRPQYTHVARDPSTDDAQHKEPHAHLSRAHHAHADAAAGAGADAAAGAREDTAAGAREDAAAGAREDAAAGARADAGAGAREDAAAGAREDAGAGAGTGAGAGAHAQEQLPHAAGAVQDRQTPVQWRREQPGQEPWGRPHARAPALQHDERLPAPHLGTYRCRRSSGSTTRPARRRRHRPAHELDRQGLCRARKPVADRADRAYTHLQLQPARTPVHVQVQVACT
jgi:hypothetical protein